MAIGRADLRYVVIYLGLPNLFFWLLGEFFYLARPLFVVDYIAVCIVSPLLIRRNSLLLFGVLFLGDLVFSFAPTYHLDGGDFVLNAYALLLMNWPIILLSVVVVLTFVVSYIFLLRGYFLLISIINLRQIAIVCFLGLLLLVLDVVNGSNVFTISQGKWHFVNQNIAGINFYKVVLAIENATITKSKQESVSGVETQGATSLLKNSLGIGSMSSRKILLVVVESYGSPVSDNLRLRLAEPFERPALKQRYEIRHGEVPFVGSTVSGEIRELCGQRITSPSNLNQVDFANCLPAILKKDGYETIAIHGFSSRMFGRNIWYPQLGFEKTLFVGDIETVGKTERCGHIFRGVCDSDVIKMIGNELVKSGTKRQFIYWLTLNTHLPVAFDTSLEKELNCVDMLGVNNCRIPDDRRDVLQTNGDGWRTSLSWSA